MENTPLLEEGRNPFKGIVPPKKPFEFIVGTSSPWLLEDVILKTTEGFHVSLTQTQTQTSALASLSRT